MPIYEFACPRCRVIFSFLSKRIEPERKPACPKCGGKQLAKEISRFAMLKGGGEDGDPEGDAGMPDLDDPRVKQALGEIEREMGSLDEGNPRQMAHLMRKMRDIMPAGAVPKDLDMAIKRLEQGEDPEKIEEDMGDIFGEMFGEEGNGGGSARDAYTRDDTLYDY